MIAGPGDHPSVQPVIPRAVAAGRPQSRRPKLGYDLLYTSGSLSRLDFPAVRYYIWEITQMFADDQEHQNGGLSQNTKGR